MHHGCVDGRIRVADALLVPGGVVVPGNQVQFSGELKIIQRVKAVHQVGGKLCVRHDLTHTVPLPAAEVQGLMGYEALPVQLQPMYGVLTVRGGAFDLTPVRVVMGPELGVPRFVQGLQRSVPFPQPLLESDLAKGQWHSPPNSLEICRKITPGWVPNRLASAWSMVFTFSR